MMFASAPSRRTSSPRTRRLLQPLPQLTGLSEEIINPATIDYFVMLAAATVFIPVVQQFEAVVKGESTGIMVTYMSNAIAGMHNVLMNAMARHRAATGGAA